MNKAAVPRTQLGSFLSDAPPPRARKKAAPIEKRVIPKDRVRAFLNDHPGEWFTMQEIAGALVMTVSRVNDAMCMLCNSGDARRLRPATGRRCAGQKYQTTQRGSDGNGA